MGKLSFLIAVGAALMSQAIWAADNAPLAPPVATTSAVIDDYFGTKVADPYRWMEDRHGVEFLAWAKGENDYTRALLEALPNRNILLKRIEQLDGGSTLVRNVQTAAGVVVYEKRGPEDNVFKLYLRKGPGGTESLLLDPNEGMAPGKHGAIDYIQLSPEGSHVAIGISEGGSEESVVRIVETRSGKALPDRIDRTEYGSPSWLPDGRSFFYNRFTTVSPGSPETAKYLNSKAYRHALGEDPDQDRVILAVDLAPEVRITPVDSPFVFTSPGSHYALGIINHGSAPEVTLYIKPLQEATLGKAARAPWRKIADVEDAVAKATLHGDDIYLLSHKNASRYKILRLSALNPDLRKAVEAVGQSSVVIQDLGVAKDALYVKVLDAGVQKIRRLDYRTKKQTDLSHSLAGGISELATSPRAAGVLFPVVTWVQPQRWYSFDPSAGEPKDASLAPPSKLDTSDFEFEEVRTKAHDGTDIPLSLIHKRGLPRDGERPT